MVNSFLWRTHRCTGVSRPFFAFILLHLQPRGSPSGVCLGRSTGFFLLQTAAFRGTHPTTLSIVQMSGLCMAASWVYLLIYTYKSPQYIPVCVCVRCAFAVVLLYCLPGGTQTVPCLEIALITACDSPFRDIPPRYIFP